MRLLLLLHHGISIGGFECKISTTNEWVVFKFDSDIDAFPTYTLIYYLGFLKLPKK